MLACDLATDVYVHYQEMVEADEAVDNDAETQAPGSQVPSTRILLYTCTLYCNLTDLIAHWANKLICQYSPESLV